MELENQGVLSGEVNLSLRDQQGNIYAKFERSLEPNQIVVFHGQSRYSRGELGLRYVEGANQSVPVVIAKVTDSGRFIGRKYRNHWLNYFSNYSGVDGRDGY